MWDIYEIQILVSINKFDWNIAKFTHQPYSLVDSIVAVVVQWQGWLVAMETTHPAKPKVATIYCGLLKCRIKKV